MVFCIVCAGCGFMELGRELCALCESYCSTSLVLLTMGIMMPETCWDKSLIINVRLVASCWFLSLSSPLKKFICCKLVLLISLLVIRVSERTSKSSYRSLFAPKILSCLERDGAQSVHALCFVALFLRVYLLGFPLPVTFHHNSILAYISPRLGEPRVPVAGATNFLTLARRIYGSSTWELLRITFLASEILKMFSIFLENVCTSVIVICEPIVPTHSVLPRWNLS